MATLKNKNLGDERMSFIADHKARRTCDPERGIELIPAGGGSDGTMDFILRGGDIEFKFSAVMSTRPFNESDRLIYPDATSEEVGIWTIFAFADERREMATEAMRAYKIAHGIPQGTPFESR